MRKGITAVGAIGAIALAVWGGTTYFRSSGPAVPAPEPTLRLLSQTQYINTITQIFGTDVGVKVRFAPVTRVDGLLGVGASTVALTTGGVDPLDSTARAVADQVVDADRRKYLIPCTPANLKARDDKCATEFFSKAGRLLYRRPLTDNELKWVVDAAGGAVGPAGDFYAGISYALSGMLVSPQFLYIWEKTESTPGSGERRLDGYSKATRLSFLLWNAAPDEELLQAAEKGDLHKSAGLRKQVDRMIASSLYENGVRAFFNDFFVTETFDTLTKDSTIYPAYTLKVGEEAREQLLRTVVDHLVTRGADYRDLYTSRRTFLSSDLGVLYKMAVDLGSQGWVPYEFAADEPRAGILTQIGFLSQYAHEGRSSATRRGRAIREVVLCQKVPDPPPDVDFSKFEDPKNANTARERLTSHSANPTCAGCHAVTDPIGLALEAFDGAGQFRTADKGHPIDASGKLDGVDFADAVGLGKAVRDNPALKSCIVNRLYAYSVGRKVTTEEQPLIASYEAALDKKGYKFDEMLRLVVLDKTFFAIKPPSNSTPVNSASVGGSHAN